MASSMAVHENLLADFPVFLLYRIQLKAKTANATLEKYIRYENFPIIHKELF
jgi:hypothetical protein